MDDLEKRATNKIINKITNENERTLCVFASEPLGVVDDLLEVGGIYQLSPALDPLICREINDYAKFEDVGIDALENLNIKKIAYFHHEEKVAKKYRKKASQNQEKTLAKKLGGEITPGSGAFGFHKGDVKSDEYLGEAKFTDSQEYRLTLKTWNKIKNEAYSVDKTPIMEIILDQDNEPIKLIVIAPLDLYDKIGEEKSILSFESKIINSNTKNSNSVVLYKDNIKSHIDNVIYNFEGKIPLFVINLNNTILNAMQTDDFIRMINA